MSLVTLDALRSRIERFKVAVQTQAHSGFEQSHVLEDGSTHLFKFTGVKSPEQLEDELLSLFVWVWSLKDHFKQVFRGNSRDPKEVERLVNGSSALQLVADIANRAKHGGLNESRSAKFAELVNVGWAIPMAALSKLTVGAFDVHTEVVKPELVSLHASIRLNDESEVDAFAVLDDAMNTWEGLYAQLGPV